MAKGYRSGLEDVIDQELTAKGVSHAYEPFKLPYLTPPGHHNYTPDFILYSTKGRAAILVETKGRFLVEDRKKHLLIKQQHKDIDLRFVFQNPQNRISKLSNTTYAAWCDKNGFKWAKRTVPQEWIDEVKGNG